jgi:hypothetical protein
MGVMKTVVCISCRITWHEQCEWIRTNCKNPVDQTIWWQWNIGYEDIYFELEEQDATLFKLRWA